MATIERSTIVNVPIEMICRYLREPANLPALCPNLIEVNDIQAFSANSKRFTWLYKMLGVRFAGRAEIKEIAHNRQLEFDLWGGINATIKWSFRPANDGVALHVLADYVLPKPLLKGYLEDTIVQHNIQCVETMLVQLKTVLESHTVAG